MARMHLDNVQIKINDAIYQKDPFSSELGKQIVAEGLVLMANSGYEAFTFKKLANQIGAAESAIYRYFSNKHKLLLYYANFYWSWIEYSITLETANIQDPSVKLTKTLEVLVNQKSEYLPTHLNLPLLSKVIISESPKAFFTKEVESENQAGIFSTYRRLCEKLSNIVYEINPDYPFAKTLGSTVMEAITSQKFFIEHLPRLSDFSKENEKQIEFYQSLILKSIS